MPRPSLILFAALLAGPHALIAQAAHAGSVEDGHVVFQHSCVMCHSTQPGVKIVGPSLAGVLHGQSATHLRAVRGIILNGKDKMPAEKGKLDDQQMADLLAYLRTL